MYMFAYGQMYIYKQGFTIRGWVGGIPGRTVAGRAHFLQQKPLDHTENGPIQSSCVFLSSVQKRTNAEAASQAMGTVEPRCKQTPVPCFWWPLCIQEPAV